MSDFANTDYEILEILARRWSPRRFSDRAVEPNVLRRLFEAARWAPSSFNEQPWRFVVATKDDREHFDKMVSCLVDKNAEWARDASVLMLSIAKLNFTRNEKTNRHAFHDVGMAIENLIIQATALDLYVHQMAGFDVEKARQLFAVPEGFEPVAMMAIGYRDDSGDGRESKDPSDRERREFTEFVFGEKFGKASSLFEK